MNTENTIETKDTYLPVTWGRATAVWWAWIWRSFLVILPFALLRYGLEKYILAPESFVLSLVNLLELVINLFLYTWMIKWVFSRKQFKAYHIALLAANGTGYLPVGWKAATGLFWANFWRNMLIFIAVSLLLFGASLALKLGLGFEMFGHLENEAVAKKYFILNLLVTGGFALLIFPVFIGASIYAMKLVLNKQFKKYRVVLVPNHSLAGV